MADPNNPAPLEDVAVEYITQALQALGAYAPTHPQLEIYAKTFYKGIYRGIWHFLDDHLQITWPDFTVDPTLPEIKINSDGSTEPIKVMPKDIFNIVGSWKNE